MKVFKKTFRIGRYTITISNYPKKTKRVLKALPLYTELKGVTHA